MLSESHPPPSDHLVNTRVNTVHGADKGQASGLVRLRDSEDKQSFPNEGTQFATRPSLPPLVPVGLFLLLRVASQGFPPLSPPCFLSSVQLPTLSV